MAGKVKDFDLYYNGQIIQFEDSTQLLEREPIEYVPSERDQRHVVQGGDRLTFLAWKYYTPIAGDNAPKYWKYIADANQIFNPLDLSEYVGKEIIIPDFNSMKLRE